MTPKWFRVLTIISGVSVVACNAIFGLSGYQKSDDLSVDADAAAPIPDGQPVSDASGSLSWARWAMPNGAETGPNPTSYSTSKDGVNEVVTDAVTKLVWQRAASAKAIGVADARTQCTKLGSGWRLPTRIELVSLLDYGRSAPPYIDLGAFPAAPSGQFWTTSPVRAPSNSASYWSVDFGKGAVETSGSDSERYARCVRLP